MPYPTKQQAQTLGELWVIATHPDRGGSEARMADINRARVEGGAA
jgi:hypothetical protein